MMYKVKGNQYLIGFIFQICFWKLIITYITYIHHRNCHLYASIVKNKTIVNNEDNKSQ